MPLFSIMFILIITTPSIDPGLTMVNIAMNNNILTLHSMLCVFFIKPTNIQA